MLVRSAADVADLVRAARRLRHMSQQDLATSAGVSRRWLIGLEAGKPGAEIGLVLSVLNTLGVPLRTDTLDAPMSRAAHGSVAVSVPNVDLDEHLRYLAEPR
jgi:HTH-type transcriptional regulator/antitoxin HipB